MDGMYKVSVILPTYNRGNIIDKSIKSVIAQTYAEWELIIADDCSSDNSPEVCSKLARKDGRIRYYRNQKNLGLPRNRNVAISHATGDLILFTEDDMVIGEKCIEILVETYKLLTKKGLKVGSICPALVNSYVDSSKKRNLLNYAKQDNEEITSNSPCVIDEKTGLIYRNFSPEFKKLLLVEDCHSCSIYPHSLFDEFKYEENAYKGTYTGEESDLHFRIRKNGYKLYFQPEAVMYHNVEEQGGCRQPLYKWGYYFMRNHTVFLARNYGKKSIIMVPNYLFFLFRMMFNYYLRGRQ